MDINAKDGCGDTAFITTCWRGHVEVVRDLLKHENMEVNAKNKHDRTGVLAACDWGCVEVVCELLKHCDVDVSAKNNADHTALISASLDGRIGVVRELLGHHQVDVNAQDFRAAQRFSGRAIGGTGRSFASSSTTIRSTSISKVHKATLLLSGQPFGDSWMWFMTCYNTRKWM